MRQQNTANNTIKRVINIDSRFRAYPTSELYSSSNFLFKFSHPYKNTTGIRLVSVEIPTSGIMAITEENRNTSFNIVVTNALFNTVTIPIKIPEAIYSIDTFVNTIQGVFDVQNVKYSVNFRIERTLLTNFIVISNNKFIEIDNITGMTKISEPATSFILDFNIVDFETRVSDWGIGYNMGFMRRTVMATPYSSKSTILDDFKFIASADSPLNIIGYPYLFIKINDFNAVEHIANNTLITALAKVITVRQENGYVSNGSDLLTNEYIFTGPTDIKQLNVSLLDPYGEVLEMPFVEFSFLIELTIQSKPQDGSGR